MNDIKAGKAGLVPAQLRDGHYSGAAALGNAQGYKYAHDDPDGVVANNIRLTSWWASTTIGHRPRLERDLAGRLDRLRAIIRKKKGRP